MKISQMVNLLQEYGISEGLQEEFIKNFKALPKWVLDPRLEKSWGKLSIEDVDKIVGLLCEINELELANVDDPETRRKLMLAQGELSVYHAKYGLEPESESPQRLLMAGGEDSSEEWQKNLWRNNKWKDK